MEIGPSRKYYEEQSVQRLYFKEKQEAICNEIRIYVISLYKFFCQFIDGCDWDMVQKFLSQIDAELQSAINSVYTLQLKQFDENGEMDLEETYSVYEDGYDDGFESEYPFDDYTPTELEDVQENPYLFETPGAYNRMMKGQVKNRNTRSMVDALQKRFSSLNISLKAANTLIEGLRNVHQTETNLRRFANFDTLDNI
jgi:hypothetical protein